MSKNRNTKATTQRAHRIVREKGKLRRVYDGDEARDEVKIAVAEDALVAMLKAAASPGGPVLRGTADQEPVEYIPTREDVERAAPAVLRDLVWRLLGTRRCDRTEIERLKREATHKQEKVERLLNERRRLHATVDLLAFKVGKTGPYGLAERDAQDLDGIPF